MYKLLLIGLLLTPPTIEVPDTEQHEAWWAVTSAQYLYDANNGYNSLTREDVAELTEYELPDGRRIDIYYKGVAWEVDWVKKWPESIGQSMGYAIATNSDPGIILLMKNGEDEYYNAALTVVTSLRAHGYKFRFMVVNVDNGRVWYK